MSTQIVDRDQAFATVLLHGGWHCSASWGRVVPRLLARGHRVVTPDLPGHGWRARYPEGYFDAEQPGLTTGRTGLENATLERAADVAVEALTALKTADGGRRTVVVSHSSSGAIASRAAERSPDLVDHLVYVAAIVPSRLRSALEIGALPEYGSPTMDGMVVGDPRVIGALRINPRSTDPQYRELLHRKFYSDMPPDEAAAFLELLCPDQPLSFLTDPVSVTRERWGRIPRTYVKTLKDNAIAPAVQEILIRDADLLTPHNRFRTIAIESSHSPFASLPEILADIIDRASDSSQAD
ncbi:alpha/beta fold hydrolase [Cryptosporangium sp. NPDC048952]|uniref:alpha/beta fold hydrolase n=1 Tax=Cryptosporangium sp. NPDC048952 TaxID=3363961 RepID=UPI003713AE3E